MTFAKWLDTFLSENEIDTEERIEVEGAIWGTNYMTLAHVVEAMKLAPKNEQKQIKATMVALDFRNAPIVPFIAHLAKAIAL